VTLRSVTADAMDSRASAMRTKTSKYGGPLAGVSRRL